MKRIVLSYPGSRQHDRFPTKLFSIAEVNCRFIDIHPCLSSILNVFHYEMQCNIKIHYINANSTAINTCKHLFSFGQREVICLFTLVTNNGEHTIIYSK